MINDLIDLYYYIRSTDDIRDLEGYKYQNHTGIHTLHSLVRWNATYTDHDWKFTMTAGSVLNYRQIFLSKNEVEIHKSGSHRYAVAVPAMINETVSDLLMNYIDSDEIIIMNYIYLEMYKLKNRSRPYERSNP